MIANTELSDLFFNSHPESFELLFADEGTVTQVEMKEALIKDATEFIKIYPDITFGYTAGDLANDFLLRM